MARPLLLLASESPQRAAILRRLGIPFVARPTDVTELTDGPPVEVARENALRKAHAAREITQHPFLGAVGGPHADPRGPAHVPAQPAAHVPPAPPSKARAGGEPPGPAPELVLGCDTLVALRGVIYGKPPEEAAARATLEALSGATHEVISGLALLGPGALERVAVARTRVSFRELSADLLHWYLSSGEWRGRAGGYAIQGAGAALVREIEGDYENVVGLPVAALLDLAPELIAS
ncbi:MAG TPA: Maf family protein [Solirubrobacteraceae bacterium]|nr:Maf family protein [Solirubrobacteraceae bacterium]